MAVVDIYNRALIKIGSRNILSAITDPVPEASIIGVLYADLRDTLLQSFTWNFAMKRVALSETTAPAFGFDKAFQLPADCLRAVIDDNANAVFRVEDGVLLTDALTIDLVYIAQVTDTTSFPPMFREVLAAYIASEICEALTSNTNQATKLKKDYLDLLGKAKKADSQEGTPFNWRPTYNRRT